MKRPTRVPASSVVRMNSTSNMMAKWYHSASRPLPNVLPKMLAMPTASDGAPPVRANSVFSPISLASICICSTVTGKPQRGNGRHRIRGFLAHHAGRAVDGEVHARIQHAGGDHAP